MSKLQNFPNIEVLVTEEEIEDIVARAALWVAESFWGQKIILVGVLKGSWIFLADLARQLAKIGFEDVEIEFIDISSYGVGTESGEVRLLFDLQTPVFGQNVIVVDDILDTGKTLEYLLRILGDRQPKILAVCALLSKPARRTVELSGVVCFVGREIENVFVVGYGLDHNQKFRHLPVVGREIQ